MSVVGDFDGWDCQRRYHPMRSLGASGVWELFIPGVGEGALYKFEIRGPGGAIFVKTDPYGTRFEAPPGNAAIVCDTTGFTWGDRAWVERRHAQASTLDRPVSIYEVHLGLQKLAAQARGGQPIADLPRGRAAPRRLRERGRWGSRTWR